MAGAAGWRERRQVTPRVVSFDGDNTLWDFEVAQRNALTRVREHISNYGPIHPVPDVDQMIAMREQVGQEWGEESASLRQMRREGIRRAVKAAGIHPAEDIVGNLFEIFMDTRDEAITPYPDVPDTLSSLKANGWTTALLTNGNANVLASGVADLLDHLLYAEEIGTRKPNSGAFEAVSLATNCELSEIVHVGDSLEHDVAGALNAGVTAIWLNREGVANSGLVEPHIEISTLRDLPGILAEIQEVHR